MKGTDEKIMDDDNMATDETQDKNKREYWIKKEGGLIVAMMYDGHTDNNTVGYYGKIFWDHDKGAWRIHEMETTFEGHIMGEATYNDSDFKKDIDEAAFKRILDAYKIGENILTLEELAGTSPEELRRISGGFEPERHDADASHADDRLKTIDDVKRWLETNGYVKFDDNKGPYVTHARYKGVLDANEFMNAEDKSYRISELWNSIYTGPPMRLDMMENNASKVYLDQSRLDEMIIKFLDKGEAEAIFPLSIKMDSGPILAGQRYSNHITDEYPDANPPITYTDYWVFEGDVKVKMHKNKTGDVRYDAEIKERKKHTEIEKWEDIELWLEEEGYIKKDREGIFVANAEYNGSIYTGPPMLLDGSEKEPYKIYLEKEKLEGLLKGFFEKKRCAGMVSEESFPIDIAMMCEGWGYKHLGRYDKGRYVGDVKIRIERKETGYLSYSAELNGKIADKDW